MRNLDEERLDYVTWPDVATDELPEKHKARFIRLRRAIVARMEGASYDECRSRFAVSKSELLRQIHRCATIHADGRVWGFRALISHKHTRSVSMGKLFGKKKNHGTRDSFRLLIERHEEIFDEIKARFLRRKIKGGFHESRVPIKALHNLFLTRLREAGVTSGEYPFNVQNTGLNSMHKYLKKEYQENIVAGVKARMGDDAARRLDSSMNETVGKSRGYPFKRVLADGHRLHAFMAAELPTPDGIGVTAAINRPWLFLLMDEYSRAIIGYHLSLNSEYDQLDVMQAVKSALTPWKPKVLTIPDLAYHPNGGLPGGVIPELARARWEEFYVDNAKANLANLVKERLHALIGCDINAGPVRMPERRGGIERAFRTISEKSFGRLPTTTGSGPRDGRRRNPEETAVKLKIMLHEMEELLDVIISNYNATPNCGVLNGRTPLEVLSHYISSGGIISTIPDTVMENAHFFSIKVKARIRGGIKQARAPHINYQCVTYTNDFLRRSPFLVGRPVTLVVDTDDLRQVKVFLEDGTDFGILTAHGSWGITPHDLKTRRAINRLKNEGKLAYFETTDPVIAYERYHQANRGKTNSLRNASKREILKRKKVSAAPVKAVGQTSQASPLRPCTIHHSQMDTKSSLESEPPAGGLTH